VVSDLWHVLGLGHYIGGSRYASSQSPPTAPALPMARVEARRIEFTNGDALENGADGLHFMMLLRTIQGPW
jgi:hypothetical protein